LSILPKAVQSKAKVPLLLGTNNVYGTNKVVRVTKRLTVTPRVKPMVKPMVRSKEYKVSLYYKEPL
jgi:hypothetical protein